MSYITLDFLLLGASGGCVALTKCSCPSRGIDGLRTSNRRQNNGLRVSFRVCPGVGFTVLFGTEKLLDFGERRSHSVNNYGAAARSQANASDRESESGRWGGRGRSGDGAIQQRVKRQTVSKGN
jgi:hypothetical protein